MGWFFVGLLVGGIESAAQSEPMSDTTAAVIGGIALLSFISYVLYKLGEQVHWLLIGERRCVADMRDRYGWTHVRPAWRDRVAARIHSQLEVPKDDERA